MRVPGAIAPVIELPTRPGLQLLTSTVTTRVEPDGSGQPSTIAEASAQFASTEAGRVVIPKVGMGVEFLDIDADSNATLLAWIENLRKSC